MAIMVAGSSDSAQIVDHLKVMINARFPKGPPAMLSVKDLGWKKVTFHCILIGIHLLDSFKVKNHPSFLSHVPGHGMRTVRFTAI
jgi:hypothetical protein